MTLMINAITVTQTKTFSKKNLSKKISALLLLALLAACETGTPNNVLPSGTPTPGSTPTPAPGSTPLPTAKVQVQLQIQNGSSQMVSGAVVSVTSPTQPTLKLTTDASGKVTFPDLRQDGEYSFEVTAPGYESASRKANLGQLATQGQKELLLAIVLSPLNTSLRGRVLDNAGRPVAGATVFDARQSVTTDSEGRFQIGYSSASDVRLAISKSGFQPLSRAVSVQAGQHQDLGDLALSPKSGPLRLGLDASHSSLGLAGTAGLSRYAALQTAIGTQGFQVQTVTSGLLDQLDELDVLMILSPSTAFSVEEIGAIQAFVLSGRKLVITGEWAGFTGFDGAAVNQLLSPLNVQFGLDTLRENSSGFLNVASFQSHPVTNGLTQLKLYQTGSVRLGQATTAGDLIARTSSNSFQIADNSGSFGVVCAAPYGAGKVVLVGDTSLWSSEDSDGNGKANLDEADNRKLLQQLLSW